MALRSQTAALVVLFAALTVIFLLVGDAGVSTGVFLPEPTLTYTPTVVPTATPGPAPGALNWAETTPGQLSHTGAGVTARINYQAVKLDEFIAGIGLTAPAADAPYPLLDLMSQLSESLQAQATESGLTLEPGAFSGAIIEMIEGMPVAQMHARVQPQTRSDGQQFAGLDLVQALVEKGDGEVTFIQYVLQGVPDDAAYSDFRAWLGANIASLAEPTTEEPGEGEDSDGEAPVEGEATPEPGEPSDEEAGTEAQSTPAPEQPEPQPSATAEGSGD